MFDKLNIAYAQGSVIAVEKALDDCIVTENMIVLIIGEKSQMQNMRKF